MTVAGQVARRVRGEQIDRFASCAELEARLAAWHRVKVVLVENHIATGRDARRGRDAKLQGARPCIGEEPASDIDGLRRWVKQFDRVQLGRYAGGQDLVDQY